MIHNFQLLQNEEILDTLYLDRVDNAVINAILEWSEDENDIAIEWYMLPIIGQLNCMVLFLTSSIKQGSFIKE